MNSFDNFSIVEGDLEFEHLGSRYDFAPEPAYQAHWFAIDSASGARRPVRKEDFQTETARFLVEITSAAGTINVHIRERDGDLQIVGIER
jgi:hypothetical protein